MQPPIGSAVLQAAFVASCYQGALPPVDLQAVCFTRAMLLSDKTIPFEEILVPTDSDSCSEKLCQAEIKKWCVEERV